MMWHRASIGDLATTVTKGTTPTTLGYSFVEAGIPFVRVQNLINGRVDSSRDPLFIDEETHKTLERSQIKSGDILLSIAGTIGRPALVDVDYPLNCNQAVAIIRLNGNVDRKYVLHWFATHDALCQINSKGVTGTITNLSLGQIKSLQIPLPPLAEQKRIAAILDAADALRAKRRESLAQLDTLLQSTFLHMFGDPIPNPMEWKIVSISDIGSLGTGTTPSRNKLENFGGVIPWVKSTEVDWGAIDSVSEYVTEAGMQSARLKVYPKESIVVALYGQGKTRGKCAILKVEATVNQACCVIVPSQNCTHQYLFQYLRCSYSRLRYASRGGNQENLNMGIIKDFPIPLPPLLLQHRFATIVESVEQQKSRLRTHLAELDALFASLQARAFKGEL